MFDFALRSIGELTREQADPAGRVGNQGVRRFAELHSFRAGCHRKQGASAAGFIVILAGNAAGVDNNHFHNSSPGKIYGGIGATHGSTSACRHDQEPVEAKVVALGRLRARLSQKRNSASLAQ
jgi:hypothetical protein